MLSRIAITLVAIPLAVILVVCLVVAIVVEMFRSNDDNPWYTP